jgi:hypothetical protein
VIEIEEERQAWRNRAHKWHKQWLEKRETMRQLASFFPLLLFG